MEYVAVSALSHDGLQRDHNEDSLVIGPWTTCATTTLTPETMVFPMDSPLLVAVSDGLGGHPSGELASTIVVQELARTGPFLADEDAVRAAVEGCNQAVYEAAAVNPAHSGMGTTVAGVVLATGNVVVFNVGDSRVYVMGEAGLSQVSTDDSPPLEPGETHSAIVTQTLGGSTGQVPVDVHVSSRRLDPTERYLACSDGLSDAVSEEAIAAVLQQHRGLASVFELWRAAMEAGGPDNITVAVVEVLEQASAPES